jgi:hypothetical protein
MSVKIKKSVQDKNFQMLKSPWDLTSAVVFETAGQSVEGEVKEIKIVEPGPKVKKRTAIMTVITDEGEKSVWMSAALKFLFASVIPGKTVVRIIYRGEKKISGQKNPMRVFETYTGGEILSDKEATEWLQKEDFLQTRKSKTPKK